MQLIGLQSPVRLVTNGAMGYVLGRADRFNAVPLYRVLGRKADGERFDGWFSAHEVQLLEPGQHPGFTLIGLDTSEPPPGEQPIPGPGVEYPPLAAA